MSITLLLAPLASFCGAFLAGVATWSLCEYLIHRFLGHDARTRPNPFEVEHTRHHAEGSYFAPSWKKALTALGVVAVMSPPSVWLGGALLGSAYVAGFVGMYVTYEVIHRREHTHPGLGRYGRWARRHHFHHHFGDPRSNHGVTSPIWDHVFGTWQAPGIIRVPERLQMSWLADPESGKVRPEFAGEYEIVGRGRPS